MSSSYEPAYATAGSLLDCQKPTSGYSQPNYSLSASCTEDIPSCDNRTYSAYATTADYQGFYDHCNVNISPPACDLTYLNAAPKTQIACWQKTCSRRCRGTEAEFRWRDAARKGAICWLQE